MFNFLTGSFKVTDLCVPDSLQPYLPAAYGVDGKNSMLMPSTLHRRRSNC